MLSTSVYALRVSRGECSVDKVCYFFNNNVLRLGNRTISTNLAVLCSVAQTFSLRLILHKLKVCSTTHLRFSQARFQQYSAVINRSYLVSGRRPVFLS